MLSVAARTSAARHASDGLTRCPTKCSCTPNIQHYGQRDVHVIRVCRTDPLRPTGNVGLELLACLATRAQHMCVEQLRPEICCKLAVQSYVYERSSGVTNHLGDIIKLIL